MRVGRSGVSGEGKGGASGRNGRLALVLFRSEAAQMQMQDGGLDAACSSESSRADLTSEMEGTRGAEDACDSWEDGSPVLP